MAKIKLACRGTADVEQRRCAGSPGGLVQEPEREVCGQALFQEVNRRVLGYLDLGGQDQSAARIRARSQEQPETAAKHALCFSRGQQFEVRRCHRIA